MNTEKDFLVFTRKEWIVYGWFTFEELDAADEKGFIGNRYGVDCYLNSFIPSASNNKTL